jgi:hypothetical protein
MHAIFVLIMEIVLILGLRRIIYDLSEQMALEGKKGCAGETIERSGRKRCWFARRQTPDSEAQRC